MYVYVYVYVYDMCMCMHMYMYMCVCKEAGARLEAAHVLKQRLVAADLAQRLQDGDPAARSAMVSVGLYSEVICTWTDDEIALPTLEW